MHIPPPNGSAVYLVKPLLSAKQMQDISDVTDVNKVVRENKIDEVILKYFRARPIPGFNAEANNESFNFYAQLATYPRKAPMEPFLRRPHIVIYVETKNGAKGIRALSINPEDFSFGPVKDIKLTPQQYTELVNDLNLQFEELNVPMLLSDHSKN